MKSITAKHELMVLEKKGQAITTSRNVSEVFNKRHDNVLQIIKKLECSIEFSLLNFKESNYKDSRGKVQPECLMTKDGFVFLAMGFTGKKAAEFKESYINQFNQMEKLLREKQTQEWQDARQSIKDYGKDLNDTIKEFVEYATLQGSSKPNMYYKHFASLANRCLEIKDGQRDLAESRKLQTQTYVVELIKKTLIEEMQKQTNYKESYVICKYKVSNLLSIIYPLRIGA